MIFLVLATIDDQIVNENTEKVLTLSALDREGHSVTFTSFSENTNVIASVSNDTLTLTPATNWNGTADISVIVTDGSLSDSTFFLLTVIPVNDASGLSIPKEIPLSSKFILKHSYPNPFNPQINIHYELPELTPVTLTIYDMTGRETAKLYDGTQKPGYYTITWNASEYSSGIYFINMIAGDFVMTEKLMLVR